jgi:cytochrome c biogenesis protein CcmG/thiol:disulfide interchange protein DsbE
MKPYAQAARGGVPLGAAGRAALVAGFAACLTGGPVLAVDVGQAAPQVELAGSGAAHSLGELQGRVVYLDFWASWCAPCRQSFPWMNEMQKKYGSRGLQVLGINLDTQRADADRFLSQLPAQFALAFDAKGESAKRFGVKGMPTSVLIGKDGKVLFVHQGFRVEDRAELEEKLTAALAAP